MPQSLTAPSPWLRSRGFDLVLIVGVLTLALALGGVATRSPVLFAWVLVFDLWLLAYPHVASTFVRLAVAPETWRYNRWWLVALLPAVALATGSLTWWGGVIALNTLYFVWQTWHYTRQSYGISRAYQRRTRPARDHLADVILYAFPIWGLLHRSGQGMQEFYGMPLHAPQAPAWAVGLAGTIAILALVGWLARALIKREFAPTHTAFVLSHVIITVVSYVWVEDITQGWLFINIWHNAQYLLFVWAANTQRFGSHPEPRRSLVSRLCRPQLAAAYAALCLVAGGLFYLSLGLVVGRTTWNVLPLVLVAHMTVNFYHYCIDAVIWRRPAKSRG